MNKRPSQLPNPKFKRTGTFVVTERCNFACRYCYVHQEPRQMSLEVAKAGIDMLLADPDPERYEGICIDLIGGEPLLQAAMIEAMLDYAHAQMQACGHYYLTRHIVNINTNGTLYGAAETQRLIATHRCVRIGMTIDGDQAMHDQNRVYHDGRGTWADVMRNAELWKKQMGPLMKGELSTKVTINHDNLALFRRGIVYLMTEVGLPTVHANVVFEDVWQDGDDDLFEHELMHLGAELRAAGVELKRCSLFTAGIGRPIPQGDSKQNWCGCGRYMISIDPDGHLYPCNHFVPSGLGKRKAEPIGHVLTRVDPMKLAPYLAMNRETKSPPECLSCDVATGCAWCAGFDFDEYGTLDKRATYICRMHKARVRAVKRLIEAGLIERPPTPPWGGRPTSRPQETY